MAPLGESSLAIRAVATPIGDLTVVASPLGIREVRWGSDGESGDSTLEQVAVEHLNRAIEQLEEYFQSGRMEFELALDLEGSDFQQLVWQELVRIPFGETRSYGSIADTIGRPKAARAVGAATGRNPAPVLVPCHRVVGASGALTGFAGGLEAKRILLAHEAEVAGETRAGRLPGF